MGEQIQVDFLPVESGEKSGDAIALRYGNFSDRSLFKVVVIDGGTMDSGSRLVEHIKEYYKTEHVDLVICTHPDADHASGLREVMNNCTVGELWIHKPWEHSEAIRELFHDGRITTNSLSDRLKEAYNYAHQLVEIAEEKGIDIREPFAERESEDGVLTVLGPSTDYYRELLPEFARSPQAKTIQERLYSNRIEKAINWIDENLQIETLSEDGVTSAENRSSAVVLFEFGGKKILFTGDAGIDSMKNVLDFSKENFIDISRVDVFQIPHHGSKRNISPSVLDAIKCEYAYASASKEARKHPAKKVTNALKRRDAKVYTTEGVCLGYHNNAPRDGWFPAAEVPFYNQVEE
ncbi:MBL fold metallo-hydrolase [Salegentibacter sp. BLCTC]|uniref:ComEC/Rec2 family competence protein n=1 Tax=Salegentibacter sp. BLCTC TaxID=2697368 RepID=UPI00187B5719|nr:MBL fold metallo-hydrolase [Salegentibacter sp. BLCTC]MBE7639881.1 MBL fold metallo-hydrolase [Salegentibacter sp. BLCTC]